MEIAREERLGTVEREISALEDELAAAKAWRDKLIGLSSDADGNVKKKKTRRGRRMKKDGTADSANLDPDLANKVRRRNRRRTARRILREKRGGSDATSGSGSGSGSGSSTGTVVELEAADKAMTPRRADSGNAVTLASIADGNGTSAVVAVKKAGAEDKATTSDEEELLESLWS